MPAESPQKTRSFSLSIGQLTFGSFLLVLAAIATTSIASVVSIRQIDATFAELQRLRSVGDLAEDIDRRMNELRLAARDFVTDPGTQSTQVGDAAAALGELLKKTRLELAPEQQDMIDGVTVRLSTYRNGIERISALINRRAELIIGLPPLREQFDAAIAEAPDPVIASTLFQIQSRIASALLARNPSAAEQAARKHAVAGDSGFEASHRRRQLRRGDHRAIGPRTADRGYRQGGARLRGPPDRARHRTACARSAHAAAMCCPATSRKRWPGTNGRASCSAPPAS